MTPETRSRFSLLVPAFNAEATLGETLQSLLDQTSPDWEAMVVDDGSYDSTFEVASAYAARDSRIRVVRQANAGAGPARNTAAAVARGEWLLPLDADDFLCTCALERLSGFISEYPGYDLYSCGTWLLYPDHREPFHVGADEEVPSSFTLHDFIERNRLLSFTAVSPTLFDALGGFSNSYLEDYDFWLRAFAAGARHIHDPERLFFYRVREDSKNASRGKAAIVAAEVLRNVAEDAGIDAGTARRMRRQAEYCAAMADRWELERTLRSGGSQGARMLYVRAKAAYPRRLKWLAGLLVMTISPRLFARMSPPPPPPRVNVDNTFG